MGSTALSHPIDLSNRDVQTEEELGDILGEGRGPAVEGVAVVQAQGGPDLREHQGLGHAVVYGDVSLPGKGIIKETQLQVAEPPPCPHTHRRTRCLPQHPLGVGLQAEYLRPGKRLLPQAGGPRYIFLDVLLHLLPNTRHPQEDGRLHLLKSVHQGALPGTENPQELYMSLSLPQEQPLDQA